MAVTWLERQEKSIESALISGIFAQTRSFFPTSENQLLDLFDLPEIRWRCRSWVHGRTPIVQN